MGRTKRRRGNPVKTKFDRYRDHPVPGRLGGWLNGKYSYLWFGEGDRCLGTLSGGKLLRLARAIVRHMEGKE